MQARSRRPQALLSFSSVLLGLFLGAALFAHNSSAVEVPDPTPSFKAHTIELRLVVDRIDNNKVVRTGLPGSPVQFACQSNDNPQPLLCYGPYQMREAYGVSPLLKQNITGRGRSIVIVDAYGSPTVRKDLRTFNTIWGLPEAPLHIYEPYGHKRADTSWIAETSLDVEWAHAMAPEATINLVVGKSSSDVDIYYAIKYAIDHNLGDVISLSFGENEACIDPKLRAAEHRLFARAAHKGITVLAATGDTGSAQATCNGKNFVEATSYPATDPYVLAVGGTALNADALTGVYRSESAWNEASPTNRAGGGGYSTLYKRPAYQAGIVGDNFPGRAIPDISLNASVNGGVLVFQSDPSTSRMLTTIVGGTSAGAPELAAMLALGAQMTSRRWGFLNFALYKLGMSEDYKQVMNDITTGDNILSVANVSGYTSRQGWDPVTGWGSPRQAEPFLKTLYKTLSH